MNIIIIGNGIAGVTAARHIRKNSDRAHITLISAESAYFFSRPALMYLYTGQLRFNDIKPYEDGFWKKNRITLIHDGVEEINYNTLTLRLASGGEMKADKIILAVGSEPSRLEVAGEQLPGVSPMYSIQDLASIETYTRNISKATVIGGGLIGVELTEMLVSKGIETTFLIREKSFWANVLPAEESAMVGRHLENHGVKLITGVEVKAFEGAGRLQSVAISNGRSIPCEFAGVSIGVRPRKIPPGEGLPDTGRGILVNEYMETSAPGVYAVGDCAEVIRPLPGRRPIEPVWYVGKAMGECAAMNICGIKTAYNPGIWYNSAKFFDLEYQVYGRTSPEPSGDLQSWYYRPAGTEKSIRIFFTGTTHAVEGIHSIGIRLRESVCRQWIAEGADIDTVKQNLHLAGFDPEFSAPVLSKKSVERAKY